MSEQEPEDTCRPVEVDGEIIDVFGREEMTEEDRGHFTEIVRAAKRKAEADDRARFAELRQHGLKARHETRVERAIRRQVAEEIAQALDNLLENPHALGEGCEHCDLIRLAATTARRIGTQDAPHHHAPRCCCSIAGNDAGGIDPLVCPGCPHHAEETS